MTPSPFPASRSRETPVMPQTATVRFIRGLGL